MSKVVENQVIGRVLESVRPQVRTRVDELVAIQVWAMRARVWAGGIAVQDWNVGMR